MWNKAQTRDSSPRWKLSSLGYSTLILSTLTEHLPSLHTAHFNARHCECLLVPILHRLTLFPSHPIRVSFILEPSSRHYNHPWCFYIQRSFDIVHGVDFCPFETGSILTAFHYGEPSWCRSWGSRSLCNNSPCLLGKDNEKEEDQNPVAWMAIV